MQEGSPDPELRRRAEEAVREKGHAECLSEHDVRKLCHELEVHQAELELQNEALQELQCDLRTSEEKYRDLYEFAPLGYFTLDPHGTILETNLAGTLLFGRDRGRLIGARFGFFLEPEYLEPFNEFLARARDADTKETCDVRLKRAGGEPAWVLLEGQVAADAGEPRIRVAATDISRQVNAAERALRESEERERRRAAELQAVMEAVPAAVFIAFDPECRFIFGSRWTYDLFHMPPGSNLSKSAPEGARPAHFRTLNDGVEIPPEELPLQKAAATGRPVEEAELDLVFTDGTVRRLLGNAVPLLDETGRARGAVGVFIDITERKRAEKALISRTDDLIRQSRELEAARDEANMYLDIMTHDVRNANNVSGMYADLLLDLVEGNLKIHAEKLHASIDRSSEILRNVATIRRAHEETGLVEVDLDAVIREEIKTFPDAAIRYVDPPVSVLADALLPTVFANLIGNAVKYGGPDAEIAVRVEEEEDEVLVSVEDTGPGIPDEVKGKLFTRFERGMARGRGEGLGLYIVRTLVTRYGGNIRVDDRVPGSPGEGAAFRFTLRKAA